MHFSCSPGGTSCVRELIIYQYLIYTHIFKSCRRASNIGELKLSQEIFSWMVSIQPDEENFSFFHFFPLSTSSSSSVLLSNNQQERSAFFSVPSLLQPPFQFSFILWSSSFTRSVSSFPMISTEERSPSGRDNSTARLTNSYNNNNNEENNLYYQYVPSPPAPSSPRTTSARAAPASHIGFPTPGPPSPILHNHHQLNNHHQEIVLRDPTIYHQPTSTAVALPNDSTTTTNGGIAEFIQNHLSSRIIPKLGSIVKRFSLNYSGEGLVTDRQRTRTVRVGIRFQVQVDSFVNNRLQQQEQRPRAILRTQSAPSVEQLDSGFSSPTADIIFPPTNSRQLALEYSKQNSLSNPSISTSTSEYCCGSSGSSASRGSNATSTNSIGFTDSSSGVSSEASSPVLNRRQYHHQIHYHPEEQSSSTLAFHNRINQALNLYRNQQLVTSSAGASTAGSPPADSYLNRRSSVQVYRRGSSTPPERSSSVPEQQNKMEDSSSYQVLRHFPGTHESCFSLIF